MIFVDANYLIRYIVQPQTPVEQAMHETATTLIQRVARNQETGTSSESVLAEVVFMLGSPRHFGLSPADIVARLKPIVALRGFRLPHKRRVLRALDLYATSPKLGFVDALTIASVEHSSTQLATFDSDFDRVPGVKRWQP